jgi:DNA-binding response OmpR family regulator
MQGPERKRQRKLDEATKAVAAVAPRPAGVLVVESDPDLQWTLARTLTIQGNRVVGTSSGEGALALIAQWPVSLVLVAEDLPGMDGLEVAKRLRESHPHIPVVLMTGEESADLHVAARLVGAVGTLTKPFRLEALGELLKKLPGTDVLTAPSSEPAAE